MKRILLTRVAFAAPSLRLWMTAGQSLAGVLILLAGCSGSGNHESTESKGRTKEPAQVSQSTSPGTVELKADIQRTLHLMIEPLKAASAPREVPGFGRVLDPAPLAADVNELATARAASLASAQEWERLKLLQKQNTASVRALQAAEAAAARDRLLAQTVRDRIELSWGPALARRSDLAGLIRSLTSHQRVVVRVELPVGEGSAIQPQRARLTALTQEQSLVEAEFVGVAPATDPQLQGRGFLFLTRDNPLNFTPGAAVSATLVLGGDALHGVFLPGSAIVRHDARTWVYVQKEPSSFARTPVTLGNSLPGGWLITQGLRESDRAVTQGAEVLLSEELKPQTIAD